MKNFWESYKFRIIGAGLGVVFHSLLLWVVMTGKGLISILLILFDFPILIFLYVLGYFIHVFGNELFEVSVGVGGTIMYGLLGWKAGPFLERHAVAPASTPRQSNKDQTQNDDQDEENQK